ncbi:MAG: hypothetical protein AB7G15_14970 [Alphaproteobacteria bacterium]
MFKILTWPGNWTADRFGLPPDSEHRQILRMFVNTLIGGAVAVVGILLFAF